MRARSTASCAIRSMPASSGSKAPSTKAGTSLWSPWISSTETQKMFEPNRNGNKEQKHLFALRDFLYCAECGCKITAELQRGHVYYRCTHGKGRDLCHEKAYTREERLLEQVESILASIQLGEDLIEALRKEAEKIDAEDERGTEEERRGAGPGHHREQDADRIASSIPTWRTSSTGTPTSARPENWAEERLAFEQRRVRLEETGADSLIARLDRVVGEAGRARLRFRGATTEERRDGARAGTFERHSKAAGNSRIPAKRALLLAAKPTRMVSSFMESGRYWI